MCCNALLRQRHQHNVQLTTITTKILKWNSIRQTIGQCLRIAYAVSNLYRMLSIKYFMFFDTSWFQMHLCGVNAADWSCCARNWAVMRLMCRFQRSTSSDWICWRGHEPQTNKDRSEFVLVMLLYGCYCFSSHSDDKLINVITSCQSLGYGLFFEWCFTCTATCRCFGFFNLTDKIGTQTRKSKRIETERRRDREGEKESSMNTNGAAWVRSISTIAIENAFIHFGFMERPKW